VASARIDRGVGVGGSELPLPIFRTHSGTARTHPETLFSPCAVHSLKLRVSPMLTRRWGSGVVASKCFVEDSERLIEQVCRTA
jgi:hypothetical protein